MGAFKFDQMPYLCMVEIFDFFSLSLFDLLRCRAVSRQFQFYADQARKPGIDELVVTDQALPLGPNCKCKAWHSTNRPINFQNAINLTTFAFMRSSRIKLDQQLKFLHIHLKNVGLDFQIWLLNHFAELVHLELDWWSKEPVWFDKDLSVELILVKLRVLKVGSSFDHLPIVLSTPSLETLACESFRKIQFE